MALLSSMRGGTEPHVALLFDPMVDIGVDELVLGVDLDHLVPLLSQAADCAEN
jgi:hypothetical protein